jgi:hypothetical protein
MPVFEFKLVKAFDSREMISRFRTEQLEHECSSNSGTDFITSLESSLAAEWIAVEGSSKIIAIPVESLCPNCPIMVIFKFMA